MRLECYRPGKQREPASDGATVPLLREAIDASAFHATRRKSPALASVCAWLFAAGAHAAVIIGLVEPATTAGAGGHQLDAISLEVALVPASALESRSQSATDAAQGAAEVRELEGERDAAPALPAETARVPTRDQQTKPAIETKQDPVAQETEPPAEVAEKVPPAAPPKIESRPEPAPAQGGSFALAAADARPPSQAAAIASAGAVERYARSIVDMLNRARPKGLPPRTRGTVKVAFGIGDGGTLAFVRVAVSSGNAVLDDAAVSAVRQVTFPAPPPGMTTAQLTYEVPYHFR